MSPAGYTLQWKGPRSAAPTDGAVLRADTLGMLDRDTLAATRMRIGRVHVPLGEVFDIVGSAGQRLTVRGAPPLDHVGEGMANGELVIEGDVGDDLGASMKGGTIRVTGDAGARVGGPSATSRRGMTGGRMVIQGNAGDYLGLRMRRGWIVVGGRAGKSPGYRMLAGTIALGGGPADHPGLEMRRGSILLLDPRAEVTTSAAMRELGTFELEALPGLRLMLCELNRITSTTDLRTKTFRGRGPFRGWVGDVCELGRGELWQMVC